MPRTPQEQRYRDQQTGFDFYWRWGDVDRTEVAVDVSKDGVTFMEWAYPKVKGFPTFASLVVLWREQAKLQAQHEWKERDAQQA